MTRLTILSLVGFILFALPGCASMLHELQPHRLWRLNYQTKSENSDGSYGSYFSVDDSLDTPQKSDSAHGRRDQ